MESLSCGWSWILRNGAKHPEEKEPLLRFLAMLSMQVRSPKMYSKVNLWNDQVKLLNDYVLPCIIAPPSHYSWISCAFFIIITPIDFFHADSWSLRTFSLGSTSADTTVADSWVQLNLLFISPLFFSVSQPHPHSHALTLPFNHPWFHLLFNSMPRYCYQLKSPLNVDPIKCRSILLSLTQEGYTSSTWWMQRKTLCPNR